MAKIIVYTRPDGIVSVINPSPRYIAETFGGDEDAAIAALQLRPEVIPPGAINVTIMDRAAVPRDREFRDAWIQAGLAIDVDLPKARGIQEARISRAVGLEVARLGRSEKQARLGGRVADAAAEGAKLAAVEGLNLATIATEIAAATDLVALAGVWPTELREAKS